MAGQRQFRRETLADLSGRVVEVGAGNGLNFEHYPASVTEVVAVEPEPSYARRQNEAAAAASVPVRVVDGVADALPIDDGSCDGAVASLVLCTVPDQAVSLAELRRVLRPDGELRFYEHVVSQRPAFARFPARGRRHALAARSGGDERSGGCHPARDTLAAIQQAGFVIEECRRFDFRPTPLVAPATPRILGVARA